jgi:arylsulfatase A-like enzyme
MLSNRRTTPRSVAKAHPRLFCLLTWTLGVLACLVLAATGKPSEATRVTPSGTTRHPNILFILTDDQRFDAMSCAGNRFIRTPNLDQLAAQGVRFSNQFVTTSICCASRASIFTGQYERRHGISDFKTPLTAAQWAETYPALLRATGYRTGFIGKFGVGEANYVSSKASDFDFWRGFPGQAGEWFINPEDPSHTHATARFGNDALDFLDGCSATQPFCLSLSFNAPHARDGKDREFEPDSRDKALYQGEQIPLPKTAGEQFFRSLPQFVQTSEARQRWKLRFATPELYERTMRDYYRLISGIDREVGRIRAQLAARGLAERTIIIFTSDNGWLAGEHGLADKWFMYEESIRVPLIIFDPRLPPWERGRTVAAMTLNIDLAPTMLEMAGVAIPERMQGRSLVALLRGTRPVGWRTDFFYEHHFGSDIIPPSEGIRTERWAYLRWLKSNQESEELYDIRADRWEVRNFAADPAYRGILAQLRAQSRSAAASLR